MGKEKKTSVSKKAIAVPNPSADAALISQVVAESVKAAMATPEKPKKELNEADLFMLKNCPIDKYILELPHNLFDFHFEDEIMFITLKEPLEDRLNNEGIVYRFAEKYSYIDLLLNPEWDGAFSRLSGQAAELYPKTYDETKENDQFSLLSFIMLKYFQHKFGKIDRLEDVDRPIPYNLFVKIVNKQKNLKVMCLDKDGNEVTGYLKKVIIQRTDEGIRILAELKIVSRGKEGFVDGQVYCQLPFSNMMMTIENLGITILTPEMEEKYKARGAKYVKYNENPAYCYFKGFAYRRGGWFGDIRLNIASRIMTDINAFRLLNSNIDDSWYMGNPFNNNKKPIVGFSENDYWRCAPIVYGFAFGTKDWIRMNVEHISDIVFSENAFEELIIPEKYKEVFLACLSNDIPSLDSIDGKGSGKIFLLYGPPGVGKTLTAESVAEYKRMPLYYVSVGELGTDPETMEDSLSKIMEVALSWNAVVLLDEVDVFAQDRKNADIERTAMTAILLRLLERYSGIMFMTTNLINNLDEAFITRAIATIEYKELTIKEKAIIWANLLSKAQKNGIEIHRNVKENLPKLGEYNFNGRTIKNIIRLAYSMAVSRKGNTLTMDMLNTVIELNKR